MRTGGRASRTATVALAVAVTAAGVLPAFLVGALAVQIRGTLEVGPGEIGLAAAVLFGVAGVLARPLGRLVQRIGARRGVAAAAALSTVSLTGLAVAPNYPALLAALVVGGVGNALAQPAANLGISHAIGGRRLGLAFGIKQSSVPVATLIGGSAVPGIALVLGWRWALAAGAAGSLAVVAWGVAGGRGLRTPASTNAGEPDRGLPRAGLVVLTIGGGLGTAASTSLGVFLVDSGVRAGLAPGTSGWLFALCSILGLTVRVALGWTIDRHPGRSPYVLIANLLAAGGLGYLLLAAGSPSVFVAGALAAYGAGWTWVGLFHFAIVRDNRLAAASATGFVQTGLSLGAAGGPLVFGVVADAASYRTAWAGTAVLALFGALTIRTGRRMVRRSRGQPTPMLPWWTDHKRTS